MAERLLEFTREYRVGSAELDIARSSRTFARPARRRRSATAESLARLEATGGSAIEAFAEAGRSGRVELVPSAPTHAVLPLVATREGAPAPDRRGLRSHRRRSATPAGFWLPECAYDEGLEHLLAEFGIEHFCVDQSAHEPASRRCARSRPTAPVAFPIDWEAIRWLWAMDGYPSDPLYADFHRKSLRGTRPGRSPAALRPGAAARRAASRPRVHAPPSRDGWRPSRLERRARAC